MPKILRIKIFLRKRKSNMRKSWAIIGRLKYGLQSRVKKQQQQQQNKQKECQLLEKAYKYYRNTIAL